MAAGISIFTLMGSILVDSDKADESIKKTEKNAEGLASKFGSGMKTAAKWGAAIGAAAIAGGTALFGMAKSSADTTDRIDKLSQKIGISRSAFQEYEYILSQNGTSVEVLQKGLKTLGDRMDESIAGTGKGADAFKTLKLSATDLNGELKSSEQMFEESAKALMAMPDGAEKSRLAFDLFGKAGQELMPMLNGSADGFDDLKKAANDMGLVLSDESVAAGALFTDTMDNVKRSLGGVTANIGVKVMPMFQTFLDWVLDHMPEIQEIISKVFEFIGKFVMAVVDIFKDYLIPTFQAIFDWTKENWPTIQKIIEGVFNAIKSIWDKVLAPTLKLLWDILKSIVDWVSNNWPTISKIFETVFNAVKFVWDNVLKPVLDLLLSLFKGVVDFVKSAFPGMQRTVESVFDGIGKSVKVVTGIFDKLTSGIKTAWDWLTKWNREPVANKTASVTQSSGMGGGRPPGFDGSHADGLASVPFDGYRAILHKNERVLTAKENENYSESKGNLAKEIVQALIDANITKPATIIMDGKAVGKGLINIVDNGLSKNNNNSQIGKGVLA